MEYRLCAGTQGTYVQPRGCGGNKPNRRKNGKTPAQFRIMFYNTYTMGFTKRIQWVAVRDIDDVEMLRIIIKSAFCLAQKHRHLRQCLHRISGFADDQESGVLPVKRFAEFMYAVRIDIIDEMQPEAAIFA